MKQSDFRTALKNLSAHLNGLRLDRFICLQFPGRVSVYMDPLGWFRGEPGKVIEEIAEAAKAGRRQAA
jgi:hypothetical protein